MCLRTGNLAGGRSRFSVGYPPEAAESWAPLREELASVKAITEKLWASIADLQKKGRRLSEPEESLMKQLLEQRELYAKRRDALVSRLKKVNQTLSGKTEGRIRCERLYPVLEVQIGLLTEEITTEEENCDIHVEDNEIHLE